MEEAAATSPEASDEDSCSYSDRERLLYTGVFIAVMELPLFAAIHHFLPSIQASGAFEDFGNVLQTPMLPIVVIIGIDLITSPLRLWLLYRFAAGKKSASSLYSYVLLLLLAVLPPALVPVLGPFFGSTLIQVDGESLFPLFILFVGIFALAWIASDAKRRMASGGD